MLIKRKDLIERVKREVSCKDLLEPSKKGFYCCPFCDSGHKQHKTGAVMVKENNTYECYSCGDKGDSIDLIRKIENCDFSTALRYGAKKLGIDWDTKQHSKGKSPKPYSLEQYADEKQLAADFLADSCGLSTKEDYLGIRYLEITYLKENGDVLARRKRYGDKDFRWTKGTQAKGLLYGLHTLDYIRKKKYVLLVEGESDAQTLWHLGFPALGVPGATVFSANAVETLQGLTVYVHQEPDQGGEAFVQTVRDALLAGGFDGEIRVWRCSEKDGTKDPSDLFITYGKDKAVEFIKDALDRTCVLPLEEEVYIEDAPIPLVLPRKWHFSLQRGICCGMDRELICHTPILLTRRLVNYATHTEKVEVSFYRDGAWHTVLLDRSAVFQRKSVTRLADYGCMVTSENAKALICFLSELEAANDGRIPKAELAIKFGWQEGKHFFPDEKGEIIPDSDQIPAEFSESFAPCGSFAVWLAIMGRHRVRNRFRFLLAASFAAPLLRIARQRSYIVYNWCDTRGGKTAALKAASSVWGDPEGLAINFNATHVGLARTAGLFCDVPLCIDERQQAGDDQRALDRMIYLLSNGKGKTCGTKTGGLDPFQPVLFQSQDLRCLSGYVQRGRADGLDLPLSDEGSSEK